MHFVEQKHKRTKMENSWKFTHSFKETSSYKNRKLKVKLWSIGALERKKRAFFVPFILSEETFFNIGVLSQCIVYWMHFQNIHTFTYQKSFMFFLLVFKNVEYLQCILKLIKWSQFCSPSHLSLFHSLKTVIKTRQKTWKRDCHLNKNWCFHSK